MTCGSGKFWRLTAEHGGGEPATGISELTFEWIINGQKLKLEKSDRAEDNLVLPSVIREIRNNLVIHVILSRHETY